MITKNVKRGISILLAVAILMTVVFLVTHPERLYAPLGNHRPPETKLLFLGDMMFDRTMRTIGEQKGYEYLFSCLSGWFSEFDSVIGNLEGPVTTYKSFSEGTQPGDANNTRFTFSPKVADTLRSVGIDILHIGNNHIFDFGSEGVSSTRGILSMRGLRIFGDPLDEKHRVLLSTHPSAQVAFVSYNEFSPYQDARVTEKEILSARETADVVVVYTHWGDEYVEPPERVRVLARRFIDAGADVVIGSHPHVVQESEVYQGKTVYYSLGNFIFDQYWNEEVRTGLALEVVLREGSVVKFIEHPVTMFRDGRTCRNIL